MPTTRFAIAWALLIAVLATNASAMGAGQDRGPSTSGPAGPGGEAERLSVRVVDTRGRGVSGVEVKVTEADATPADDGPGHRTAAYRTGPDGRVRIEVDARYRQVTLEARPDDRTIGWASRRSGQAWPKATDDDPIALTLLTRSHEVEGLIVDARGKPIPGVRVRAVQFDHDANGFATDYPNPGAPPSLASAVTDEAGRYRISLPEGTGVIFHAVHPWFVGPSFHCQPDDRTIATVSLEEAGGIAGTVVDASTGRPAAEAVVTAQRIEHTEVILNGNWGGAVADAQGRFRIGALAPGVYNVLFASSPRGRRFTARAVEGVRVKAGADALADLRMIEGRRLNGAVIVEETGRPIAGQPVFCYSASHPRSGAACQGTYSDDRGHFEHFVPPGPALVYIAEAGLVGREHRKTLDIPDDRDPAPVVLKRTTDANAKPFRPPVQVAHCEVRVRVRTDAGAVEGRALSGRLSDRGGRPIVGVQVSNNGPTLNEAATDRMGIFRLKGLPGGPLRLHMRRDGGEAFGLAAVPAEAAEVDLVWP